MVKIKGAKDKVKRRHKQSFARQFLADQNMQIYQGETQILKPLDTQLYKIKLPRTQYQVGEQFAERGETKQITSYEELLSIGLCITSRRVGRESRWEVGQRMKYALQFADRTGEHINKIPKEHYVEYDAFNEAARLIGSRAGPMGAGEWKLLKRGKREGSGAKADPYAIHSDPDAYMEKMYKEWNGIEDETAPIRIDEVPIMITKNNEIVCLPKTGDMPSILISGMKGCLTKDTLIMTKEHIGGIPMSDLINKGPFEVYSYNTQSELIELKKCDGVEFAKHTDIFELETENGLKIKCTSDHPFLLSANKYKKAIKLNKTDELVTTNGIDKIKTIKHIGIEDVYDCVNVEDNKNFIANGFVVSNSGKSFCLHSMVSRLFWKPNYNYKICILNDSSRETGTWCLPNNDPEQIQKLSLFNENPLPLPVVYFHPTIKEDYEKLYMGDVGFDITLPWKKIIAQHDKYLNLKESTRYFTKIVDPLLNCKSEEEINEIMDNLVFNYGFPANTATKVRAEIGTILDSKMTDLSFKNQGSWNISKNPDKKYNPYTAAIHAGLLPVLSTEYISNSRSILSIYFNYFVEDLFVRQKQDPDFLEEQSELLLVVDECHNISSKGQRSTADMLLRRCVREGRPRRLGQILATQRFGELPDVIKDNSTHLIVFKNPGEAGAIASQYNLGKHIANVIRDLGKHEMMAYTTEHFIVYDSSGNKRRSKLNEVFVGSSLPPYSLHKKPKTKEGVKLKNK